MAKKKTAGSREVRFSGEEKLALVKRVESGETQSAVALDAGVTRQYISQLCIRYKDGGEEALLTLGKPGRQKAQRLTTEQREELHAAIRDSVPRDLKIRGKGEARYWTLATAEKLAKRMFGFRPVGTELRECFRDWKIRVDGPPAVASMQHSREFLEWQKSPEAAELHRREKLWEERMRREEAERGLKEEVEADESRTVGKGGGAVPGSDALEIDYEKELEGFEEERRQVEARHAGKPGPGKKKKGGGRSQKSKRKKRK